MLCRIAIAVVLVWSGSLWGQEIVVQLPPGTVAKSASATAATTKSTSAGAIQGGQSRFTKLLPKTPYDLTIALADGTVLQGVDLSWYNEEPVDLVKDPLTDDDRAEIAELLKPDKDFWNKQEPLFVVGDHNRVTVLVKLIRDREFYGGEGEIICRFDLWYFRFEAGGWMKIQQGQRQLRRDRFKSRQDYEKAIDPIRWMPELGGIKVEAGQTRTITLTAPPAATPTSSATAPPATQLIPATQPAK